MAKGDVGFPELVMQMKITNRLLAAQLKATLSQQDMVRLLSSTGATNQEIANVLDTTPATVATTLQRLKKKEAAIVDRSPGVSASVTSSLSGGNVSDA